MYKKSKESAITKLLREFFQGLLFLLILVIWFVTLLHPVMYTIHYGNPLYLALYLLIVPEFFIAALISGALFKIIELI